LIGSIGAIARSGTRELGKKIKQRQSLAATADLISHFGVGFYSAFMVADRIEIVTRRARETVVNRWQSDGNGRYTFEDAERNQRGTSVTIYLKPADPDNGIEDYCNTWRLSSIVKRCPISSITPSS